MAEDETPIWNDPPAEDADKVLWAFDECPKAQWRQRQRERLAEAKWCERCRRADRPLQVSVVPEIKELHPWEHPDEYLHYLCEPCYRLVADTYEALRWSILDLGVGRKLDRLTRYLHRLLGEG
jgi:hypothetical protein